MGSNYPADYYFAQFEIQMEAQIEDRQVHLITTQYNDTYTSGTPTYLHMLSNGGNKYCPHNNQDCVVPFNNGGADNTFTLHIHSGVYPGQTIIVN